MLLSDIEDIPENIKYCKNLQVADFSSNPLQRYVETSCLSRTVFTVRRYASAVYAVFVCPSVCLSVCLFVRPSVCHKPALYQNG